MEGLVLLYGAAGKSTGPKIVTHKSVLTEHSPMQGDLPDSRIRSAATSCTARPWALQVGSLPASSLSQLTVL
jgi:hypothetical protein